MTGEDTVQVFESLSELSRAAAELIKKEALKSTSARGRFNLVLSGGSTPRKLFKLLAREYGDAIPWRKTHVFWSDERYVAPDHLESNFAAAEADFLQHVPIPALQVHRIPTDFHAPESAAIEYDVKLHNLFPTGDSPAFDLALLGIGADGHTASIFPGSPIDVDRWVAAVVGPEHYAVRQRITLTPKALNGARVAAFLVSGPEKQRVLKSLFAPDGAHLPAAAIHPREELIWLVDRAAHDGESA